MRVLFLCHRLPYPADHGAKIRAFNFIRHLGQSHSVTVASLALTKEERKAGTPLKNYCDELLVEVLPSCTRWMRASAALGTSIPSSVAYFWSAGLYKRIEQRLLKEDVDMIFVYCAVMAQYVLRWKRGVRILDYVDIDSAKWADYSRFKSFPVSLGYALEARKLRNYERAIADKFHHCSVTTEGEREELENLGLARECSVIPNGVDIDYFCPNGIDADKSVAIVFLGRMDYFPNIDGVCYFVEKILPIVRAKIPGVEFRIIGSSPTRRVRQLSKVPGVFVTGYVPDVRSYIGNAVVSVAPLRIARGTQNKILESMAAGLPVVATSIAARGIQAIVGEHLLVADEADIFARKVIAIFEQPKLRRSLSSEGRKQVVEVHGWRRSMNLLEEIIDRSLQV